MIPSLPILAICLLKYSLCHIRQRGGRLSFTNRLAGRLFGSFSSRILNMHHIIQFVSFYGTFSCQSFGNSKTFLGGIFLKWLWLNPKGASQVKRCLFNWSRAWRLAIHTSPCPCPGRFLEEPSESKIYNLNYERVWQYRLQIGGNKTCAGLASGSPGIRYFIPYRKICQEFLKWCASAGGVLVEP